MREVEPVNVVQGERFVQLVRTAKGDGTICGVTTAGEVWCWGHALDGEAVGEGRTAGAPHVVYEGSIEAITAGVQNICVRDLAQSWFCTGEAYDGRDVSFAGNVSVDGTQPVSLPDGEALRSVAMTRNVAAALSDSHEVFVWGHLQGALSSSPEPTRLEVPWRWNDLMIVEDMVCGNMRDVGGFTCHHLSFAMQVGLVLPAGFGEVVEAVAQQLELTTSPEPQVSMCVRNVRDEIACTRIGYDAVRRALEDDVDVQPLVFAEGDAVRLSGVTRMFFRVNHPVGSAQGRPVDEDLCAVTADGDVSCVGSVVEIPAGGWQHVVLDEHRACALDTQQRVWCWGDDARTGLLGRGLPLTFEAWTRARGWMEQ